MRGQNDDEEDRPRPIFSRNEDGRLHAGGNQVAPSALGEDESEIGRRTAPPMLIIPGRQPAPMLDPSARPAQAPITVPVPAPKPAQPTPAKQGIPTLPQTHVQPRSRPPIAQAHQYASPRPKPKPEASTEAVDVGDLWTEQERIRLRENWEEEQRKTERRSRRKEMFRKKVTGIPSPAEQASTPHTQPGAHAVHTDPKEITLNISMPSVPKITLPKFRIPALPRVSKGRMITVGVVVGVAVLGAGGYQVYKGIAGHKKATASDSGVKVQHLDAKLQTGKPNYDTVLPNGKPISDYGAWVRVSPADKNPVYAYADELTSVLINVSEQPLPDSFKSDTEGAMQKLAEQYSANDKVYAGNITVYIGTSIKGPQSVLFVKDDILILMKSASKITDQHWIDYIKSLR